MPQHFHGQPGFPQLRHHTPSASPPIQNGMVFHGVQRAHTPQPHPGSRPGSRNDMRRMGSQLVAPPVGPYGPPPQGPQVNGYAYVPQPAIYNPQNAPHMPPGHHYPHPPPPPHMQQMQMEHQRQSSVPPSFPPQQPQQQSPPPPVRHSLSPPQQRHGLPSAPTRRPSPPPSRAQMEPPSHENMPAPPEPHPENSDRSAPQAPMLNTTSAIKKLPHQKQHSIFTPIDESRSVLSQHLAAFQESQLKNELNANRPQSFDQPGAPRSTASPPQPKRSETGSTTTQRRHPSVSSIPEQTPPSRSNSVRVGGGPGRPRLKVQIPDEPSEAGSNTAESNSAGPGHSTDATSQSARNDGSHSSGIVLPPPSPSANTTLLSAGATGPPNPFARPAPANNPPPPSHNMIDTPASALPSRYMNEFLPSPSQFFPDFYARNHEGNTLPSPLNFATPIVGSGPSFLRDEVTSLKRKSPEINSNGSSSDPIEPSNEPKRLKVEN